MRAKRLRAQMTDEGAFLVMDVYVHIVSEFVAISFLKNKGDRFLNM